MDDEKNYPAIGTGIKNELTLQPFERPSPRSYIFAFLGFALIWIAISWYGAEQYVMRQEISAIQQAEKNIGENIADITNGLARNLAVYHGIPVTLGRDRAVYQALTTLISASPAPGRVEDRRHHFQNIPVYARLNQTLAALITDIPAFSVIWVMNTNGDCIASSNAGSSESFVGTNYADREYFRSAQQGQKGNQFAVGRVTGIPGLFFSAPVSDQGNLIGVVAVKIDLSSFSFWVDQADTFLSDPYGVIILARDKKFELHALPGNTLHKLTAAQRTSRYRNPEVAELHFSAWGNPPHQQLKQFGNQAVPVLMHSSSIPGEGLTVTVMQALPQVSNHGRERTTIFMTSASMGIFLLATLLTSAYYIGNWRRINDYRTHQAQIQYIAMHDTLTGLFSRAMIDQLITQGIAQSARTGQRLAVMFVDLDLFKNINDSMGHEIGDEILCEVAHRLRNAMRAADAVIRQGGDEFIVIVNDLSSVNDAARIARKLIEAVSEPYLLRTMKLKITASVGIAVHPEDGETPSMLMRNADSALYNAKEHGRADFQFYHTSMNADALARLATESALREVVANGCAELVLHFQPQFELATRRIVGCEALVRWQHPTEGLLAPGNFIPIAEKTGLIVQLDEWVLLTACHQVQQWRQTLDADLQVAVNISAVHFRKPGLLACVQHALADSGLPPACLELEVTESAIMDHPEYAVEILAKLKDMGVRLSIDDFGTGYSSLAYLKRFDIDVIKIDQAFVRNLETDLNDQAIIAVSFRQTCMNFLSRLAIVAPISITNGADDEGKDEIGGRCGAWREP